jgi:uncharacterized protein (TIRG00374 family)
VLFIATNVLAIGLLIWFLREISWKALWEDIKGLNWWWVATALVTDVLVYVLHGLRWKLLLTPLEDIGLWKYLKAIYTGLFANEILPLRAGEIIRCFMISRWSKLPISVTLSSFVVERVMDGFWLLLGLILSLQLVELPKWAETGGWTLAGVITLLGMLLAVAAFGRDRVRPFFSRWKLLRPFLVVVDDLSIMGHSRYLYYALLMSLPYLLMQVMPIYATAKAYDLNISFSDCLVLMVALRLSSAIPQAPGNVGVYQAACGQILRIMGVDKGLAARVALVMWCVVTLPLLVVGFIALAVSGGNLTALQREAERHVTAHEAAPESGQ